MDMDGDGKIDINEWIHGKTAEKLTSDTKLIDRQFTRILTSTNVIRDNNSTSSLMEDLEAGASQTNQQITTEEILKSFGDLVAKDELQEILDEIDENGDGVID